MADYTLLDNIRSKLLIKNFLLSAKDITVPLTIQTNL